MTNRFQLALALAFGIGAGSLLLSGVRSDETSPTSQGAAQTAVLDGTRWELTRPSYPGLRRVPFLAFADGRLSASVGCNAMGSSYTLEGTDFRLSSLISTMMACDPPLIMQAESDYGKRLEASRGWRLEEQNRVLILTSEAAQEMAFRLVEGTPTPPTTSPSPAASPTPTPTAPVAPVAVATPTPQGAAQTAVLDGTRWELTRPSYPGLRRVPFLAFADGRLSASVGCNAMGSSYTLEGTDFRLSSLISTRMACDPPLIMQAESDYGKRLEASRGWRLEEQNRVLILTGEAAQEMAFRLVEGTPTPPAPTPVAGAMPGASAGADRIAARIEPSQSGLRQGRLLVTIAGRERMIADEVWDFWAASDGQTIYYSGSDGAGGFENEGQSLWAVHTQTGARSKLMAERFGIERVREARGASGRLALVVSMRDGGLGAPHLALVDPRRGQVWRHQSAALSAIRNGRLAVKVLARGETDESKPVRMLYPSIDELLRRPIITLRHEGP